MPRAALDPVPVTAALHVEDISECASSPPGAAWLVLDRTWVTAMVRAGGGHPKAGATDVYEIASTGGVRALIDRSPMRYDVAVHLGGGS